MPFAKAFVLESRVWAEFDFEKCCPPPPTCIAQLDFSCIDQMHLIGYLFVLGALALYSNALPRHTREVFGAPGERFDYKRLIGKW